MTPKELLFELLKKDGRPDRQLNNFEPFRFVGDPVSAYLRGNRKKGTRYLDRWGVTYDFPADAPGAMPVSTPDLLVLKVTEILHRKLSIERIFSYGSKKGIGKRFRFFNCK